MKTLKKEKVFSVQRFKEELAALCESFSGLLGVFFLLIWPVPMLACLVAAALGLEETFGWFKMALLVAVCALFSIRLHELGERLRKK